MKIGAQRSRGRHAELHWKNLAERYAHAGERKRHRFRWSRIGGAAEPGIDTAPFQAGEIDVKSGKENQRCERDPADTPQLLDGHTEIELADFEKQNDKKNRQRGGGGP